MPSENSFDARDNLRVGDRDFEIYRLDALQSKYDVARLPFSLKVLLENLLRNEDGVGVRARGHRGARDLGRQRRAVQGDRLHARARAPAGLHRRPRRRRPRRDARRDGRARRRPASRSTRCVPVELVIDHSVQVDAFGTRDAFARQRRAASSSATRSATRSCAGARAPSRTSRSCRPTPASSTRSTSSTWRASCSTTRRRGRPTPTRSSAPTRTRRWSTASACSAGASAASRPRRRCSASRCRC